MELSTRKRAVLSAVIRTYIATGEPVGSKILTELLENAPSSATLRNEMSELCELGLLAQPHTSAGRVPTSRGLKLYVNSIMQPLELADTTKSFIDSNLPIFGEETEKLSEKAAWVLSSLTGLPSIASFVPDDSVTLKKVELFSISSHAAMMLAVLSDGRTCSRLCRLPTSSKTLCERFSRVVKEQLKNIPVSEFNRALLQSVIALTGIDSLSLMPLLTTLFETVKSVGEPKVKLISSGGLYNICGEDGARRFIAMAQRQDTILNLFEKIEDETAITFGNDIGYTELKGITLLSTKYYLGKRCCGRIGIIGPNRMSYEQIVPSIEYTASRLTMLMNEAKKDMED